MRAGAWCAGGEAIAMRGAVKQISVSKMGLAAFYGPKNVRDRRDEWGNTTIV